MLRYKVKPGITGWVRANAFRKRMQIDFPATLVSVKLAKRACVPLFLWKSARREIRAWLSAD